MKILSFKNNIKNTLVISLLLWILLPVPILERGYYDTLTGGFMISYWTYGSSAWRAIQEVEYLIGSDWILFWIFVITSYLIYFLITFAIIKTYLFIKNSLQQTFKTSISK